MDAMKQQVGLCLPASHPVRNPRALMPRPERGGGLANRIGFQG